VDSSDPTLDTYLYEALFKTYRNAVVAYVRSCLKAQFGPGWESQLRSLFLKEWEVLTANAMGLRASGVTGLPIRDAADLLSVNHFFTIFEKHFEILWPAERANSQLRTNVLQWARTVKAYRDPVGHPQEQPVPLEDALVALDAAHRVLLLIDAPAADSVHQIWESLRGDGSLVDFDPLPHNLPPRETIVVAFVGRTKILSELSAWLSDDQSRLWVLQGDGGKGKTAIAYTFADRLVRRHGSNLFGIVWLSAKKRKFIESHTRSIDPDVVDLETALDRTLYLFGPPPLGSLEDKKRLCLELLDELPVLIVVDDVDTLEGEHEDAVAFFLQDVSRTRSKVLFTSRRKLFGLGRSSSVVDGLDHASALAFLDTRLRVFDLDATRYSSEAKERIVEVTDGSPLYIEDLLRLTNHLSPSDAVHYWQHNQGTLVREYAIRREVEALTPLAQRALVACALSDNPVTLGELQIVARITDDEASDALSELGRLYLLPQPGSSDGVTRYSLNRNTRELVRRLYAKERVGKDIQAALRNLGDEPGDPPELAAACRRAHILAMSGRDSEAEQLLSALLEERFPEHPRVYGQLGRLYCHWQPARIGDARKAFQRAYEMNNRIPSTYVQWAIMEQQQGQLDDAQIVCVRGIERCGDEDLRLLRLAGTITGRVAEGLRRTFNVEKSRVEGERAIQLLDRARARSFLDEIDYRDLSRLYDALWKNTRSFGAPVRAAQYLQEWGSRLPDDAYYLAAQASVEPAAPRP
jgi:hypothetical protein